MDNIFQKEIMEWLISTPNTLSSSSSCSSEEEKEAEPKKIIPKLESFVEKTVGTYTEYTFKQHFRLCRVTAYRLVEQFRTSNYAARSTNHMGTSPEKSVLLCLWYLANTESFRQISDRFDVALSTAHTTIVNVVNFLVSLRDEFIKWPNDEQKKNISKEFYKKQGFKNVIGCIDGSHIRIQRPEIDEEVYVNRKGYHSILVQGICDNRKLILDVFCGELGSMHDARLLRKSSIYRKSENPQYFGNYYLLGDSAYPSLSWLVPPFRDNGQLTEDQKMFNFKLSSTRMVIEHTFGLLKGRFRRLGHFENLNVKLIAKCAMAACVLHNICILQSDLMDEVQEEANTDDHDGDIDSVAAPPEINQDKRRDVFRQMLENV